MNREDGRCRNAGFSLIELLVSMAIGLIVTLAIATVMINGEGNKRTTTSVNDINQSGSYAAYVLDRQIRSAGSGFAQNFALSVGCTVYAQNATGQILPRLAAFTTTSPFANWTAPIRLTPILIGAGLADKGTTGTNVRGDVLMVMTGTGGFEEVPQPILANVLPGNVRLANTLGYRVGDLVMLGDPSVGTPSRCMIEQLSAVDATGQLLTFGPTSGATYYKQTVGPADATQYGANSTLAQIGNVNSNPPQFSLIAVGDNATLYSNDLLPAAAADDVGQQVADGVVEMRALYGVVPYGKAAWPITWTSPSATGYDPATITPRVLRGVVAVRVGLILRTSLYEKDYTAPASIALFTGSDVPAAARPPARMLSGTDAHYRYRTVEVTIPLPNVVSAPWPP